MHEPVQLGKQDSSSLLTSPSEISINLRPAAPRPRPASSPTAKPVNVNRLVFTLLLVSIVVAGMMCVGLLVYRHHHFIGRQLHAAQKYLEHLYSENPLGAVGLMFLALNVLIVLNLGFQTSVSVLFCLIMQDFWVCLGVLFVTKTCADLLMFLLGEALIFPCLVRRIRKSRVFSIIKNESAGTPYKAAFVTRFLVLSTGTKNLVLVLIQTPLAPYLLSGMVFNLLFIPLVYLISRDVTEIRQMNRSQHWQDMTFSQRLLLSATILASLFSAVVMLLLGCWVRSKLKEDCQSQKASTNVSVSETVVTLAKGGSLETQASQTSPEIK